MGNYPTFRCVFLTLTLLISQVLQAKKYTLVVEATYSPERGKEIYETFRQWLSNKTKHDIELIIDNNYYSYWRQAKGNRMPDFTLDSPHIAAFRALNNQYLPVAVTQEDMVFHLISLDDVPQDSTVEKFLTNRKVALLPNPSLASIYFRQWFTDLFTSPQKNVAALNWQETVDIVSEGGASAAIVPQWIFDLYPNFISIKQSSPIPGRTFMASPTVPKKTVESLKQAILSLHEDTEIGYDLSYELNTSGFKEVDESTYKDLIKLLPNQQNRN